MLKRRIAVLCMLLVLGLGATSAYASSVTPSDELLALVEKTNQEIDLAIEKALTQAEGVTASYQAGKITYSEADAQYLAIIDALKSTEQKLIDKVTAAADKEGVKLVCQYELVKIGWHKVLIDPVIVPGNSD